VKIIQTANNVGEQEFAFNKVKTAISTCCVIATITFSVVSICSAFDQLNEMTGVSLKAGENDSEAVLFIETRFPGNFSSFRIPESNLLILDFPECSLAAVQQFLSLKDRDIKGVTISQRGSGIAILTRISIEMSNLDYYMQAHGNILEVHMSKKGIFRQRGMEEQVKAGQGKPPDDLNKIKPETQVGSVKSEVPIISTKPEHTGVDVKPETQIFALKTESGTRDKELSTAPAKARVEGPQKPAKTASPVQRTRKIVKKASASSITWIGFKQFKDYSRVFIKTNSPVDYSVRESENEIILDLKNTTNPLANNRRSLDTSFFSSAPVRITPISVDKSVKIKITLKAQSNYKVMTAGSMITVDFPLLERGR